MKTKITCAHTHSPRPPAPRKMPPTASASHSLDTPMMMHPATMLSSAEPTRSPWYSPTLTGFIRQMEAPSPPHTPCLSSSLTHSPTVYVCSALTRDLSECRLVLPPFIPLSLALSPSSPLLNTSHACLKMELWLPLEKQKGATLMTHGYMCYKSDHSPLHTCGHMF